jgi:serine/threonine protein kinase/WD40 repeat protein
MIERIDNPIAPDDGPDDDERVGEAVESFLALAERGQAPDVDEFVARYPDLQEDVRAALEGLELVHGLLGLGSATGSGSGKGAPGDHRIESGRRIAGYRVVRELGRGGMGTVYEAVHVGLDRPVALKVLGTHAAPDSSARRRFLNEARTAAGLHHTHIVPVFDVGQVGGLCYYAMQRIEGSGLDQVVRHLRRGRSATGVGSGSPWSGPETGLAGSGGSSINSRLGRFWLRVSSGWRGRPAPMGPVNGQPDSGHPRSAAPGAPRVGGARALVGLDDSTVSWAGRSRRPHRHPKRSSLEMPVAAGGSTGLAATPAIDAEPRGHDDDSPPFDPPRGSAYFRWVAAVGHQAADALGHAHRLGVIHRDVKPSNLLVDGRGNIWVTDFGLARRLADPGLTHHDSLLGTPRYMSPEQARTGAIDGRTDVYSLGATLYELVALRPPFDGRSAAELIEQIGQDEPVAPGAIDRRVPRDLETIVLKALAKRPADRYATAAELALDLERFINREPVKARRISPPGRLWRVACRHPRVTAFTTGAAAMIVAITTFAYARVIAERDDARHARDQKQEALLDAEKANREKQEQMRHGLEKAVEVVALGGAPNRRSRGLDLIRQTVDLGPEPELRAKLRDEAVKFLVLREVQAHEPELQTGLARGLVFGPTGHRLAVLSDDNEQLAFWDIGRRVRQNVISLRTIAGTGPAVSEPSATENPGGERNEGVASAIPASSTGRNTPTPRRDPFWYIGPRLAQSGQYMAVILPEYKGLAIIDLLPDAPVRTLSPPDRAVRGVVGDPGGKRLVTIEQPLDDPMDDGSLNPFELYLWNPEHLNQPIARLEWPGAGPPGRPAGPAIPLVAISPDGKTVAVAAARRNTGVRLFSALDGRAFRTEGRGDRGFQIDTQTDVSALSFGPSDTLATAGVSPGGTVIKIWDLLDPRTVPIILTPNQNDTWLMRYSPQGTLLAIAGAGGPIELWDPLAHSQVAVLRRTNDQTTDLAFGPDGRTLAAAGRSGETAVWTVYTSATRTQLSGFESRPGSLAFSDEGVLAGSGARGEIWFWRSGRCPELGPPSTPAVPSQTAPATVADREKRSPTSTTRETPTRPDQSVRDGRRPRGGERMPLPAAALAFDARGRLITNDARSLRVWTPGSTSAEAPPSFKHDWAEFTRGTPPLAKTTDGRTMVFVRPSSLFLWSVETADKVVPVTPPPGWEPVGPPGPIAKANRAATNSGADPARTPFREVQIAPGGERVYLLDSTQGLPTPIHAWSIERLPDARTLAHDLKWSVPLDDGAISIALRGDGAVLAVGDRTGKVTLVDTSSRAIIAKIPPFSGDSENYRLALAFSPDGQHLAVGSPDGTISLWSLVQPRQPRLRYHLPGHRGWTTSLAFDPHGRRLASAGTEPLVDVWDLDLIDRELDRLGLAD